MVEPWKQRHRPALPDRPGNGLASGIRISYPLPIIAMFPPLLRLGFVLALAAAPCFTGCQTPAPPPVESSVKPGINADYLNPDLNVTNWVERFEREGREIYEQRRAILAAARVRPGSSVADVGCGTGLFTSMLASATGPSGLVYAVDIVPKFLSLVRQRTDAEGLRNVRTVLCTESSVRLPPDSVDLVFLCDVYHHFEYPQSSLGSLHQAVRKDGEVFLIDFKREPGVSSDWILNHVRAGQATVTAEFEAAGFRKVEEVPLLKDNYVLRFRKVGR